jgi:hypothetical protein
LNRSWFKAPPCSDFRGPVLEIGPCSPSHLAFSISVRQQSLYLMHAVQPRRLLMKKITSLSAGLCLLFIGSGIASSQENMGPPKVLVIMREYLKPGRGGSMHEKTESAFVRAMTAAKWPTHYFGMDSMSGPSRSLFFVGYPSFEAWEKDNAATQKNTALSAAFDRASIADGDLLTSYESSTSVYREDLSLRSTVEIAHMRYFEISQFVVRPGHEKDWEALVKMYTDGFGKAVPSAHWATFERVYGASTGASTGSVFIVLNPMKSLAEVDSGFGDSKKFMDSMSASEQKKLAELTAACIESSQTNLFAFNPKESYPPDEWIKADSFWKPKAAAPAAKPAQ